METWFKTLKIGTRIKSNRLEEADDIRKCLAFDAITACHVADLTVPARDRPEEDIGLLNTMLEAKGHRQVIRMERGQPPTIREVVLDIGRLAGFHPWKGQRLPGAKKVWRGWAGRTGRSRCAMPLVPDCGSTATYMGRNP